MKKNIFIFTLVLILVSVFSYNTFASLSISEEMLCGTINVELSSINPIYGEKVIDPDVILDKEDFEIKVVDTSWCDKNGNVIEDDTFSTGDYYIFFKIRYESLDYGIGDISVNVNGEFSDISFEKMEVVNGDEYSLALFRSNGFSIKNTQTFEETEDIKEEKEEIKKEDKTKEEVLDNIEDEKSDELIPKDINSPENIKTGHHLLIIALSVIIILVIIILIMLRKYKNKR